MGSQRIVGRILSASIALTGCHETDSIPPAPLPTPTTAQAAPAEIDPIHGHLLHAQPRLPTIKVLVGGQELNAEIASRRVEIATGMMYRTSIGEQEAMLFVLPRAAPQRFYMRNCVVPLSAAYVSPTGRILQLIDLQPHDETGVPSASSNVQFVLEVSRGWFARHQVGVGASVRTERGSLQETFFGGK